MSFGLAPVLDNATCTLAENERVCIVGRNGEGKSTLLKIVAGQLTPDDGNIVRKPDLIVATVPQEMPNDPGVTVLEMAQSELGQLGTLLTDYEQCSELVASDPTEENLARLQRLSDRITQLNAWDLSAQLENLLKRYHLNKEAQFSTLSGGNKRKVLMVRALVQRPDLLLLDEPTNHLDIETVVELEEMLMGFPGTILFVSHDRRFIDRVGTRVLDLDRGQLASYPLH